MLFEIIYFFLRRIFVELLVMLATVLQWLVLATLTGILVGCGVSLFLVGLTTLTNWTAPAPRWIWMLLLPTGGFLNGLLLHYGYRLNRTRLKDGMFSAFYDQGGRMPFTTILIKPLAALITLSCGGSAGKESPCAHIGASFGAGLGKLLNLNVEMRKRLVACGVSAGFAGVFGTPLAGAIYGVEVLAVGRVRTDFLLPAIIGGVAAFQTCRFLGVPYEKYLSPFLTPFSEWLFFKTIAIGVFCGLAGFVYVEMVHQMRKGFEKLGRTFNLWPPLSPLIGGGLLSILIIWIPTSYFGLSLPLMDDALHGESMPYLGFLWKCLLVGVTLGSGFYGGVVTPQFVIGAIAGNAFAPLVGLEPALGASVGLVAVVAASSNTPIAAILLGVELFGGVGLPYVAGAAICAYLIIGHRSIYPDQRVAYPKSSWIETRPEMPVGQGKIRLSYGLIKCWFQRRKNGTRGSK